MGYLKAVQKADKNRSAVLHSLILNAARGDPKSVEKVQKHLDTSKD